MVRNQFCLLLLAAWCYLAVTQLTDEGEHFFEFHHKPRVMVNGIATGDPGPEVDYHHGAGHKQGRLENQGGEEGNSRHKRYLIKKMWIDGFIPYDMRLLNMTIQQEVLQAMAEIELKTCIRFHDITSGTYDNTKHNTYLRFIVGEGCWSYIGKVFPGPQDISPCNGRTTILHELFHAIGAQHEQNHPNSDELVSVNWPNIEDDQKHNFYHTPETGREYVYSEPNMNSVMMYNTHAFSKNGGQTLIHYYPQLIDQYDDASLAWAEINEVYSCADRYSPNNNLECKNGGYPGVYNNVARCICPDGYDHTTSCNTLVNKAHGGKFILNKSNREKSFDTTTIPSTDFWMFDVQAENKNDKIQLIFEEFTVPCEISLVVVKEHRNLYQGLSYCGNGFQSNPVSIKNSVTLVFLPKGDATAHVKGVFRLLPADEWCYSRDDKGYTYDGTVNVAYDFSPCLDWTEVYDKCPNHRPNLNISDTTVSYQGNRCRNVGGRYPSPMCVTEASDKTGCGLKLCDVCGYRGIYDKATDCNEKLQSRTSFCSSDHAQENCRKSCNVKFQDTSSRTCQPPSELPGGTLTRARDYEYSVGDYVDYQCRSDSSRTVRRHCLSTGEWTAMETVCNGASVSTATCDDGYTLNPATNKCYKFFPDRSKWFRYAKTDCLNENGKLAVIRSAVDQDFVEKLRKQLSLESKVFWINLKQDYYQFFWYWAQDKSDRIDYSNWNTGTAPGQNGNNNRGFIGGPDGKWYAGYGKTARSFLCEKDAVVAAADPTVICGDQSDFCRTGLSLEPRMCVDDWFTFKNYCGKTCGACSENGNVPTCTVATPSVNSNTVLVANTLTYSAGQPIQYGCKPGTVRESGDFSKACHLDGTVTGDQLMCQDPSKIGVWVVDEDLSQGSDVLRAEIQLFGPSKKTNFKTAGYIQKWRAHCVCDGEMILMALRPTDVANEFQVLGFDTMSCTAGTVVTLEVNQDRTRVEVGDFFGVSAPCMSLSYCKYTTHASYYSFLSKFSGTVKNNYILTTPNRPSCFDFPVDAYVVSS